MSGLVNTLGNPFKQTLLQRFAGPAVGLFQRKTTTPTLESPTVMPTPDDEAVKAARRRQIAEVQARSGRASTILSQTDQLGG